MNRYKDSITGQLRRKFHQLGRPVGLEQLWQDNELLTKEENEFCRKMWHRFNQTFPAILRKDRLKFEKIYDKLFLTKGS